MSDIVLSAIITVGGMLGVAVVSAFVQVRVTRAVIRSERDRTHQQLVGDHRIRRREHMLEQLNVIVGELLRISDPQINERVRYSEAVALVHRAQLLLTYDEPKEAELNGYLNELGLALQGAHEEATYTASFHTEVLGIQGRIIDATKAILSSRLPQT